MTEAPLPPTARLRDAVQAIERTRRRTAVVIDDGNRLLGTITDGDIRRCLLAGGSLDTLVLEVMNANPVTAGPHSPDELLRERMEHANIVCIPLVNEDGRFVRLVHTADLASASDESRLSGFAAAVVMAGGEGTRLRPLTRILPKPMIEIGGMPLLERLLTRLQAAGIAKVYISVNYLAHIIEDHIGDGSRFGVEVTYLREDAKLGTAGALSLLPEQPAGSVAVINGDILTTFDFAALHDFHKDHGAAVTAAAVDYRIDIPYGVIRSKGPYIKRLEEKPSQQFLCNAGIYALAPDTLGMVPNGFFNMTDLIEACIAEGRKAAVFPLHEYWSDIGTPGDLEQARATFERIFA